MNKFYYGFFEIILKGISWIATAFIPILLGLYFYTPEYNGVVNNQESIPFLNDTKIYLNELIEINISRLFMIIVILGISIFLSKVFLVILQKLKFQQQEITKLEEKNFKLKQSLESKIEVNNDDDKKQRIIEAIQNFILNNPDIISVQFYQCIETRIDNKINYEIKPSEYYVNNEPVNFISEKYSISERSLKQYLKIKEQYRDGNEEALKKYIKKLVDRLVRKQDSDIISESVINDYSFLTLAFQLYFGDKSFEIKDLSYDFQERINKAKRTGLLRGIIEENFYKFSHRGDSNKGQRIYITRYIDIQHIPHVFVITLRPQVIKQNNYADIIDGIGEKFYDILLNDLKMVYNGFKVS